MRFVAGSRPVLVIASEWHIGLALLCGCSEALEYPTTNSCGPINKSLILNPILLCCVMTIGGSKNVHVCPYILFSKFANHQIMHQDTHKRWAVSLVIACGQFNFHQVFVWVCMGCHTQSIAPGISRGIFQYEWKDSFSEIIWCLPCLSTNHNSFLMNFTGVWYFMKFSLLVIKYCNTMTPFCYQCPKWRKYLQYQ